MNYQHPNLIVHTDALEYSDAFQRGVKISPPELNRSMQNLENRMREIVGEIPTYLAASYRGYEAAWLFHARAEIPAIVRLDELRAVARTRCVCGIGDDLMGVSRHAVSCPMRPAD